MYTLLTNYLNALLNESETAFKPVSYVCRQKTRYQVEIKQHSAGILELIPATLAKHSLILSCAVHGDETAPIEVLDKILADIVAGKIHLNSHLVIVFANIAAIKQNKRYVDTNLNRLFTTDLLNKPTQAGNYEEHRAEQICACLAKIYSAGRYPFRIHLDLHCSIKASIYPIFAVKPVKLVGGPVLVYNTPLRYPVQAIIHARKPSSTLSFYTANLLACSSATLELGKSAKLYNNQSNLLRQIYVHLVEGLACTELIPRFCVRSNRHFVVSDEVIKNTEAFHFIGSQPLLNFQSLVHGQPFVQLSNSNKQVSVGEQFICFANPDVEIGHRAALLLKKLHY
ncbi:succinylglutamate desuccinylase [Catenovulum agarivorans]|uniref:succinylglutamate desuccinylase n=1 Tax=Catenovulum agarivorans TaxID=1172192 RepID=UPI0003089ABD|nr:succinylglutamate desuccinylase [Catenovulum agarivorans]